MIQSASSSLEHTFVVSSFISCDGGSVRPCGKAAPFCANHLWISGTLQSRNSSFLLAKASESAAIVLVVMEPPTCIRVSGRDGTKASAAKHSKGHKAVQRTKEFIVISVGSALLKGFFNVSLIPSKFYTSSKIRSGGRINPGKDIIQHRTVEYTARVPCVAGPKCLCGKPRCSSLVACDCLVQIAISS